MQGRIEQLNVSPGGVPKRAIAGGQVTFNGLAGDRWAHPQIHGGPDQKILMITAEVIEELQQAGFPVFAGALGENLTTRGLDRRQFRAGQVYRVGEALIELTKPRAPCRTLDVYGAGEIQKAIFDARVKARDITSPRWGMSGFYARVRQEGRVRTGDEVVLIGDLA